MVARKSTTNATARVNTSGRTTAKKSAGLSGTSIVRNTGTTSVSNTTPSYSVINMPRRRMCEKEKIGLQRISAVSPVVATKVDDEEYKISLNFEALKNVIQGYDELDLCGVNIKLCTVSGDTVFSGEVAFDKMNANDIEVARINITEHADIQELEVLGESIFDDKVLFKEKVTFEKEIETNGITNTGKITTDIVGTTDIFTTTLSADDVACETLEVSNLASINNENVTHSHITDADIDGASITDETVGTSNITTATINTETVTNSTIDNAIINTEVVDTSTINTATITDATIATATIGEETVTKSMITDATITKATISTENVTVSNVTTANIDTANIDNAAINTETVTNSTITKATIDNATITKEKVTDSEINNLVVKTTADIKGDLIVTGNTDVQALEVNRMASFREDVKVYDNFYVSGDYMFNGDGKFNGNEEHKGNVVYNGEVTFNGKVNLKDLEIDADLDDYQKKEEKGKAKGYASLDNTGKVPKSQLPDIAGWIHYSGKWNPATGVYPSDPENGDMYQATRDGIVQGVEYHKWDRIIRSEDEQDWGVLADNYGVSSVNGRTGAVEDVQDTADRKDEINLEAPSNEKYISEKGIADVINDLLDKIAALEAWQNVTSPNINDDLPTAMLENGSYDVLMDWLKATDIMLPIGGNVNVNIETHDWYYTVTPMSDITNPKIDVLYIKKR